MNFLRYIPKSNSFKQFMIAAFFIASGLTWFGLWLYGHYYVSTDNAYVNANVVQIASRVSGKINKLYVLNNQYVLKDQPLFDIDPEPFQIAVDSAKAQVEIAEAKLAKASVTAKRTSTLVKDKYVSSQENDNVIASFKTAIAELQYAKANLTQASLNLDYTKVTAPVSGWVTNLTLRVGDIAATNQLLFALISDEEFWVDANFKETEMAAINQGQKATIVTDLYPNHTFYGVVESISGGSGAAFSLLPPQNATGNWVKVTQRIPVRIHILNPDPEHQLRIGISATVTVNINAFSSNNKTQTKTHERGTA